MIREFLEFIGVYSLYQRKSGRCRGNDRFCPLLRPHDIRPLDLLANDQR